MGPGFRLSKWYGDCVTPDGRVFITYWGRLSWGLLRVPYAATLQSAAQGSVVESVQFRRSPPPVIRNETLCWSAPRLGFDGQWVARSLGHRHTLLDSPCGGITWSCEIPCGHARIETGDGPPLVGLGYADQVTLSVQPWKLPFDELRWGRFLSAEHSITWIAMRGAVFRQWVFCNGIERPGAQVGCGRVTLPAGEGELVLENVSTLRSGPLISTALRRLPGKRLWLGHRLDGAHETKWLARGTYSHLNGHDASWAIHEVVRLR